MPQLESPCFACVSDLDSQLGPTRIKLNPFTVTVLTMHRWFDISAAERDLKYKPVKAYEDGWTETMAWFKANWLPGFKVK